MIQETKCPQCGQPLIFVFDGHYHVFHSGKVNLHDRDLFNAGAVVRRPSPTTRRRLIKNTYCPS